MKQKKQTFIPDFERPIRVPARIRMTHVQPCIAVAGEKITLRLKFPIPKEIKQDEMIKLQIYGGRNNKGIFPDLHTTNPRKDGYVFAETSSRLPVKIQGSGKNYGTFIITPGADGIKAGEHIFITLKNAKCSDKRFLNKFFVLYKGDLSPAEGSHKAENVWNKETQKKIIAAALMHIIGGDIHSIKAYAPSNVVAGKKFSLLIRPIDRFANLSSEYLKNIEITCNGETINGKTERINNSTCVRAYLKLKDQGVFRIKVKHGKNVAISNPVICERNEDKYALYWGMMHAHTEMSDGSGTIDYFFHQLKNEAGLDFGATGDHDHLWEITDQMWGKTCRIVKKWNKEGSFVTFLGYEWAKWRRNGDGDRNVYYFKDDRPMYRSDDGCYPDPWALFTALKREKALIVPHHTAHGGNFCDWKDHEIEKERLIEIYQERGSYECPEKDGNPIPECKTIWKTCQPFKNGYVINALLLGWRCGFTGGGDDHESHAGIDFPRGPCNYKDGLTGVFSKKLTRKGIWEGFWNRRTIATSGARIYLYYSVNDYPLGSEILFSRDKKRTFHIVFHGTDLSEKIEIIRNGEIVYTHKEEKLDVEITWEDQTPIKDILLQQTRFSKEPFAFYYVRAVQKNREVAWASPVWILARDNL